MAEGEGKLRNPITLGILAFSQKCAQILLYKYLVCLKSYTFLALLKNNSRRINSSGLILAEGEGKTA